MHQQPTQSQLLYTRPTVVHPGESATRLAVSHLPSIDDKQYSLAAIELKKDLFLCTS